MVEQTQRQGTGHKQAQGKAPLQRKRRWGRVVGIGVGVVVLVVLVGVAVLPTVLSTGAGTRVVTNVINSKIAGRVAIGELRLGWFGGQAVRGLELFDPDNELVLRLVRLEAPEVGLAPVVLGGRQFGRVEGEIEVLAVKQGEDGVTSLGRAVGAPGGRFDASETGGVGAGEVAAAVGAPGGGVGEVAVELELTAKRVTYESPGVELVELTGVSAMAQVPDLSNIHVTLTGDLRQGAGTGRVDADVSVRDAFTPEGEAQIGSATVEGNAEVVNVPVAMVDRLAGQGGKLVALVGEGLTANVQAQGAMANLDAQVRVESERLKLDTRVRRTERGLEASGGKGSLRVTPEGFGRLVGDASTQALGKEDTKSQAGSMRLLEEVVVGLDLRSVVAPVGVDGAVAVEDTQVDVGVTAKRVALEVPGQGAVTVSGLNLAVNSAKLSEQVTATLKAQAEVKGVSGPVGADVQVLNLLSDKPLEGTVATRRLPVALVDAVSGQGGKLARTLGETVDLDATLVQGKDGYGFDGQVDAPNLKGPFRGTYGVTGAVAVTTPEPMRFMLTPAAYRDWVLGPDAAAGQLALAEPAELSVNVEEAHYAPLPAEGGAPADAPVRVDPERTTLAATITAPELVFTSAQERVRASEVSLRIDGRDLREVLKVAANMNVRTELGRAGGSAEAGSITSDTEVRKLVNERNELSLTGAEVTNRTRVEKAPSSLVDALAMQDGELAAVLGARTSAAVEAQYRSNGSGYFDVELDATNVKGKLPGRLRPNGDIELRQDAALSMNVTPEVSRVLLGKINPMLRHVASAEAPVKLTLSADNFNLPTKNFNWNRVTAVAGLDAGTLTLRPEGFTGILLQGLTLIPGVSDYVPRGDFAAKITPVTFNMQRGRLNYRDLKVAFSGVELDFDGGANLAQGKFDLTMTLGGEGIGSDLRGVSVPITGTFDKPVSLETLTKAFGGAALPGLIDDLLGGNRDRKEPRREEPRREGQEEEKPRGGLEQLLEMGAGALERERERREEERRQQEEGR